jgi:hypothetical protein
MADLPIRSVNASMWRDSASKAFTGKILVWWQNYIFFAFARTRKRVDRTRGLEQARWNPCGSFYCARPANSQ